MRFKLFLSLFAAILIAGSVSFARAQVVYSAQERHLPIAVGTGVSNFDLDYGKDAGGERRMYGISAWVGWDIPHTPRILYGLGMEAEGRDINWNLPSTLTQMRQDTITGGVVYSWRQSSPYVQPYFKYLAGMGSIDFPPAGHYSHDTRAISAPGAGLECRVYQGIWVRADYEYQFWYHIYGPHDLNPNGFTFGTVFDFRNRSRNPTR